VRYHYRGPRKLGNRNRGLHVTTRGWSSSTASAATGAESYSNIVWCARSAGFAPSAALASASASATRPSPNPSPPSATLVLASQAHPLRSARHPQLLRAANAERSQPSVPHHSPLTSAAASTVHHPRPRPAPVACASPSVARMRVASTDPHNRHGGLRHVHHVVYGDANAYAERPWA
jgi:hypothetical protein